MQAILSNVTDGIGLVEANGDIAMINEAMYDINGFPRDVFSGFHNVWQAFRWQAQHFGFTSDTGTPEEIRAEFRRVRDQIKLVFEAYAAGLKEKLA